jgi:pyridoxine/pyridoxamine 5'-phosphate oxidase
VNHDLTHDKFGSAQYRGKKENRACLTEQVNNWKKNAMRNDVDGKKKYTVSTVDTRTTVETRDVVGVETDSNGTRRRVLK